jgi:hypothetical protein
MAKPVVRLRVGIQAQRKATYDAIVSRRGTLTAMPDQVGPMAPRQTQVPFGGLASKHDADYVFYELARSICPTCRKPIDAQIVLRAGIAERMFMVMLQDFMDPWTFNQKNVMKCCKEFLLPGGKQIPFCAYNSVGYREQARTQLAARQRARIQAERNGTVYVPEPLTFQFSS